LPAAFSSLCRGLGRLGFQAQVESVGDDSAVIVSATCPLRPLVVSDPDTRPLDQGMWQGLVAAVAGDAVRARCVTEGCLEAAGPCRIVASFDRRRP